MSRIGKLPVPVPSAVKVRVDDGSIHVEGPAGKLSLALHPLVAVAQENGTIVCTRTEESRRARSMHGLFRSLIQNMVTGVTKPFEKKLEIVGVGYGALLQADSVQLTVGFSKPVEVPIPDGVTVTLPDSTHVVVTSPDKQKVGQFAAVVRSVRKPEPYKGTGIRYEGEQIRRKAGKAFGSAG